jgi:hypothetical protein
MATIRSPPAALLVARTISQSVRRTAGFNRDTASSNPMVMSVETVVGA